MISTLSKNSKFAVVGDVHSLKDELENLIYQIRLKHGDIPIFSTGDLIDRGAKSFETVEFCIADNIQPIVGNHDSLMLECLDGKVDDWWLSPNMGGQTTFESYQRATNQKVPFRDFKKIIPYAHERFFRSLPFWRIIRIEGQAEEYVISHAGIKAGFGRQFSPGRTTEEILKVIVEAPNGLETILWSRPGLSDHSMFKFENGYQIFGHTPVERAIVGESFAAVDTGAFFSEMGHLSAIILPSKEIISVPTARENFYV